MSLLKNVSITTNEISEDFTEAVRIGYDWGIRNFELKRVWGKRVPNISKEEERVLLETIKRYNLNIVAVSPALFMIPFNSNETPVHGGDLLERSFSFCERVGTKRIVILSFMRPEGSGEKPPREVIKALAEAAEKAESRGFELVVENYHPTWADTGRNTADIIKEVDNEALRVNWDPGNAIHCEKSPYPEGYSHVRGYVGHLHIKDWSASKGTYTVIGEGDIDWEGQLRALYQDGYSGYLTIETHFGWPMVKSSMENSKANYEKLKTILQSLKA